MSKKELIIKGTKVQKILIVIDIIVIIGVLVCLFFGTQLGLDHETIENLAGDGLIVAVIIGLISSLISEKEEENKEEKNDKE